MEVEIIRAFERLLIVFFAGASIFLGWHLFKIGVVSPQSGELSGKGFKFSLQKVGPGVFFSAFGAIVLSVALTNGLNIRESSNDDNSGKSEARNISLANTIQESQIKRITTAINTLDLIHVDTSSPYESHRDAINSATERLRAYRDTLARHKFSNDSLKEYFDCKGSADGACKIRKSYKEVEAWLTDTLLQE
ncbi:hypothetical protein L1D59_16070 [Pseudoalteromonas piscicida]|uniref:hypothetical protein n=1 Tax=Pseudoalteromonas piscicida TaxID=43662 RepID=UPI001EFCCB17|nr:hypothetical protein [Pseudoalteromonas piscicida]MCG9770116.1 hypothetical protein [Pseudoalteromonas piscicida]